MKKENNKKSISEKVISEIEKNNLKMKSRCYFVIKSFLFVISISLLLFFVLYLGSLIIFTLKVNNILYFHGIGFYALKSIISSFPWYLVFLSIILIIFIQIIGKKFEFFYQKTVIYSLFLMIILTFIGSFIIEKSSIHQHFFNLAQRERLPIMGKTYKNLGNLDIKNTYFGKIIKKDGENLVMELRDGNNVFLIIDEKTRGRRIYFELKEGDEVIIIGEIENNSINVSAFRRNNIRFKHYER